MRSPLAWRNERLKILLILRCVIWPALCVFTASERMLAQSKSAANENVPFCNRNEAIDRIRQQIDATKTIDDSTRHIAILIRAADLLWSMQPEKARAVFTEAFELAIQSEKENPQTGPRSVMMRMQTPDQRHIVIRAVARRDAAWAKKLTARVLEMDRQTADQSTARDSFNAQLTGTRLLDSAIQLVSTDVSAAIELAHLSLNYPANYLLSRFLYALAVVDQPAADQLYTTALLTYGKRPVREFLYLITYPFAFESSGDTPVFGFYQIPANFVPNERLQRNFIAALMLRAEQTMETPLDEGDNYNGLSGKAHLWQSLMRIEPFVRQRLPDLLERVVQSREQIFVSLTAETQGMLVNPGNNDPAPAPGFRERIEESKKSPNANERDDLIVAAILDSSVKEDLSALIAANEEIADLDLRNGSRQWLYFRQASDAATGADLAEAERLTAKVDAHDQRAFLYAKIAKALLAKPESQARAHEVLDEAISEANKAGATIPAARVLLTAANLYARIDLGRALSVLGEAVSRVNRIEDPDFNPTNQTFEKRIQRRTNPGNFPFRFYMPGLDAETAFRELAKIDFNNALNQTTAFTDKFQRAMTSLAVSEVCLQETERRRVNNPKKPTNH